MAGEVTVCVENPSRKARSGVKSILLSQGSFMAVAMSVAPSARARVYLNLEIGARESGEAWQQ